MSGEQTQSIRWFGAFRSEGLTELPEQLARDLARMRNAALRRCSLGIAGGLALPVAMIALMALSSLKVVILLVLISVFVGPVIAATALIKHGEVAWRYRAVRAGMTVERFAGSAPYGFDDTVTKRLRKRKMIVGEFPHHLLVLPEAGTVLAVDDHASPHAVRGTIAETAPLRAPDDLSRPLSELERAELAGVMDRLYKLPVGGCFAAGWVTTVILRLLVLPSWELVEWFNTWGWTVWFGIAGLLLVLAQLHAWLRIGALRSEFEGPLEVIRVANVEGSIHSVAAAVFPHSGIVWQYGTCPGPARLEGGGLLSKAARAART
jgi:hypothetical protein